MEFDQDDSDPVKGMVIYEDQEQFKGSGKDGAPVNRHDRAEGEVLQVRAGQEDCEQVYPTRDQYAHPGRIVQKHPSGFFHALHPKEDVQRIDGGCRRE